MCQYCIFIDKKSIDHCGCPEFDEYVTKCADESHALPTRVGTWFLLATISYQYRIVAIGKFETLVAIMSAKLLIIPTTRS